MSGSGAGCTHTYLDWDGGRYVCRTCGEMSLRPQNVGKDGELLEQPRVFIVDEEPAPKPTTTRRGDIGNDKPRFRAIRTERNHAVVDLFHAITVVPDVGSQTAKHLADLLNNEISDG